MVNFYSYCKNFVSQMIFFFSVDTLWLCPGPSLCLMNLSLSCSNCLLQKVHSRLPHWALPLARVYGKQRANSSHPLCPSTDCLTGSFGSSLNFSLCFTHTMLDIESLSSGNALPVINRCIEESGLCPSGDPHSHICPCRLREGTQGEG